MMRTRRPSLVTTLAAGLLALAHGSALAGCGSSSTDDSVAPPPAHEEEAAGPPGAVELGRRLSARHADDLPTEEWLEGRPGAELSLRWLAENHERQVVRTRALASLRYFQSDETRALVVRVMSDDAAHPALRAAAVAGSAGLSMDPELEAALERARGTGDPRVIRALERRVEAPIQ